MNDRSQRHYYIFVLLFAGPLLSAFAFPAHASVLSVETNFQAGGQVSRNPASTDILESAPVDRVSDMEPSGRSIRVAVDGNTVQNPRGLQYYLLIALVVLTIVILFLLVFMLYLRDEWLAGRKRIRSSDLWRRQDDHIALINSQIEEQLKKFNEL